uniref:Uncharacterized protein n=1 Tax=Arundo donax TaxID=35708 RepID=A0A0A9HXV6_ARUDO
MSAGIKKTEMMCYVHSLPHKRFSNVVYGTTKFHASSEIYQQSNKSPEASVPISKLDNLHRFTAEHERRIMIS